MKVHGSASILSREERTRIHGAVVRILGEIGVRVEHERLQQALADAGARVSSERVVTLSEGAVDSLVAESRIAEHPGALRFNAGGYPRRYLNPDTGEAVPHTMQTCRDYIRLADQLDQIDTLNCVGYPSDVAPAAMRLYEKLSFLCGAHDGGAARTPGRRYELRVARRHLPTRAPHLTDSVGHRQRSGRPPAPVRGRL